MTTPHAPADVPAPREDYVAPRDATERALAGVWAEVLGVGRVGAHDDFFALGGHSLSAARVVSRVRRRLGVELPLRAVFDAPTVAGLAEQVRAGGLVGPEPVIRRAPGERQRFRASFAQQRLWFLDQLAPAREVYHVHRAVRLRGPLDAGALRQALEALADRHESLRTSLTEEDGEVFQVIHALPPKDGDPGSFPMLPLVDLSGLPAGEREAAARRRADEEVKRPCDLARAPLWRAVLLRLGPDEHWLVLTMHQAITDAWSMTVLFRELQELYEARVAGTDASLPPVPLQYADYSHWQQEWLQGELLGRQLAYWKQRLASPLPTLHLPVSRPRPRVQTFRGAVQTFDLPAGVVQALEERSRDEGVTPFMLLLAAFATLLHRHSGQDDLLIGTPVANRNRVETEDVVGFFVNSLVLRTDVSGDPTFRELLGRVREEMLGAFAHQDVPFEKLVEELRPERDTSRHPLFQALFVLQNLPALPRTMNGLSLRPEMVHNDTAVFDLTLVLVEGQHGLWGWFEYNTDLFDADTVRRMQGHYLTLLEAVVGDPGQHVSRLPLLTEAERRQILVEWNSTRADYPHTKCIHQLVEEQVERTPDAVAVVAAGQELSYRAVNERANRLAHHLRGLGVGPGVLVGVCVRRSAEMLVTVLGILKAGGAYVPLDPAYPKDRLAFMLDDTQAPVLLTERQLLERLPETAAKVLCLDTLDEALARGRADNPAGGADTDSLAYVIYTSGSTGRPKGVVLRHNPVVNLIDWVNRTYGVGPADRLLFVTSLNFDLSVYDIFGTLAAGASVRVASGEELKDAERLLHILGHERITFWDSAPPQLQQLVPFFGFVPEEVRRSHHLRLVFLSGDWIPVAMPDQVRQTFPGAEVVSLGGATEAAIWSNYYPVGRVDPSWPSIPYGKPIQNARYHVLDRYLQPVPVGVPAELHIGGPCLAEGYLNRPELTDEKFIPDPFHDREPFAACGVAGTRPPRLYKTGDLARYFPDGNLEFLGRIDHQVKIRGYRIELGEIEAVLGLHPGVANCVVMARRDESGDRYLAGYVVPRPGQKLHPADVRRFMLEKLPDYMVPPCFVFLDAFPLNPNGKIDRQALPAPARTGADREMAYEAPRDATERALAGIWAEVLGVERVGVHDDFFALGGHSLKATQVVSRVRRNFPGIDLPLRTLFEAPVLAALADAIRRQQPTSGGAAVIPPVTRRWSDTSPGRSVPTFTCPASFAQRRLWFLNQFEEDKKVYNVPLAVRIDGPLDAEALRRALHALAERHEALRTTFAAEHGEPLQIIAATPRPVELPLADLSGLSDERRNAEVRSRVRAEGEQVFDLARGPLWRVKLLRLAAEEHLLLLTLHHIVVDHWSLSVLFGDLSRLYDAERNGTPAGLPALPIQYADFSQWQREWFRGGVLRQQLDWWKAKLAGVPVLQLPTDKPRPRVQTYRGAAHHFLLPPELTSALGELSRGAGATLSMTLLAAFQAVLHRTTNQDDLAVGMPIANRNRADVEDLLGVFINTLVLRTDVSGDPTFRELLGRVREEMLGAFAHQDVPFEKLVEELHPERDTSRHPLFQALFNFQNEGMPSVRVGGARWTAETTENGTAKFDVSLVVEENPHELACYWEYNTDLFELPTMERLTGHLLTLLHGAVADPGRRLSELPLLTEAERHRLVVEWNATRADYPRDRGVHRLVEEQAAKSPDRPAVVFEGRPTTYGELNARANQLAHHLRSLGVGPDVPVGLCVERSAEMLVGLLGILKAGGAYVPLDPDFPRDRLTFYVEDSRMPVLVTQRGLVDRLPEGGARRVLLDEDWPRIAEEPGHDPSPTAGPENLIYVIYTSGSTGQPKGVQVPHRALSNFLNSMRKAPGLTERDVLLAVTTLSFDIHALELWLPLTVGARVVVVSRDVAVDGVRLLETLRAINPTVMQATPATWRLLLAAGWQGGRSLKVLCGGEALTAELAGQLLGRVGSLWNMYGPTETTVWSTVHEVKSSDAPIPIGRPIDNTSVYVAGPGLSLVPVGGVGELLIGGDGVARGYLNRPELTAEKFLPDPFAAAPEGRVYRTGDLARYRPNGTLECLGRIDHQVKVRGYRIELGEVETVLARHPAVRTCVVVARKDASGSDSLAAYLVPQPGGRPTPDVLRRFLEEKLPEYMVPAHFVTLDAFPLTPNGKIDRKALPAPEAGPSRGPRTLVAPRDDAERDLVAIWEEVLNVRPVSVTDNFFDLGGHSFLAAVLIARIKLQLGHTLSLAALFAAPTVEKLAAALQHRLEVGPGGCLVPLHEEGTNPPLFLIAGIGGHVFTFHKFGRLLGEQQPSYGLKAVGVDGSLPPPDRVEDIVPHYLRELTEHFPAGPYLIAGYSVGAVVAYELAVQLRALGKRVDLLVVFDMIAPGYPRPLPLWRRALIHLGNFLRLDRAGRRAYLEERLFNVKARVYRRLGLAHRQAPRMTGVVADALPQEALRHVWGALKTAQASYRPRRKFDGPILLFKAEEGFRWPATVFDDPLMGWGRWTTAGVETHTVPGQHLELFGDRNIGVMAGVLREAIAKVLSRAKEV